MLIESTSNLAKATTRMLAAAAVTCAATSIAQPDDSTLRLVSGEPILPPMNSSRSLAGIGAGESYFVAESTGFPEQVFSRETSEQERLIATFRRWEDFKPGWDGEGAKAPVLTSLRAASSFVCAMNGDQPLPEPMLHGSSGRAGLFWSSDGLYADLEFLDSGEIAYYVEKGADRHKGVVAFDRHNMPGVFGTLLMA